MTGVPNNADVLAAFNVTGRPVTSPTGDASGVQFRGFNIDVAAVRQASRLLGPDTPCYGPTGGGSTMTMFRADVLQFLPFQQATGKRLANGPTRCVSPAGGNGSNRTSESAGATLVVVYRDDSQPLAGSCCTTASPFSRRAPRSTQHLQGFYQSASTRSARVTHIVGSGQPNNRRRSPSMAGSSKTIRFQSLGSSSERGWSTNTVADVSRFMPGSAGSEYGETAVTSVQPLEQQPVRVSRMGRRRLQHGCGRRGPRRIARRPRDRAAQGSGRRSAAQSCRRWAATPTKKDLFVEVNAMWAPPGTTYGAGADLRIDVAGHHHLPFAHKC